MLLIDFWISKKKTVGNALIGSFYFAEPEDPQGN